MSSCDQCGASLKEGASFCSRCGARQQAGQIPPEQPDAQRLKRFTPAAIPARPQIPDQPDAPSVVVPPAAHPPQWPAQPQVAQAQPPAPSMPKSNRRGLKVGIAIFVILCLLAGGAVAAYVLWNKDGGSGDVISEERFEEQQKVLDQAAEMFDEVSKASNTEEAAQKTVEWIKTQDNISDAGIGEGCIWGVYDDGTEFGIVTSKPGLEE